MENPEADALEFINDFKTNLFAEEVYVYTPKGKLQFYPKVTPHSILHLVFTVILDIGL